MGDCYTVLSLLCLSFPTKRGDCRHQAERFLPVVEMYLKSHFRTCVWRSVTEDVITCSLHVKHSKLWYRYTCESHFRTCVWSCVTEDAIACSYRRSYSLFSAHQVFKAPWKLDLPFLFFFFFCGYVYGIHACMCVCLQVYKGHMYVQTSVTPLSSGSCRTQNSPILISLTR